MGLKFEVLYRRCSRAEAKGIGLNGALSTTQTQFSIHRNRHSSDPTKWVTKSRKFAQLYSPKGVDPEEYRFCILFKVKPGTVGALSTFKSNGEILRGPRAAYGIPPNGLLTWFNGRILEVEIFDLFGNEHLPAYNREPTLQLLRRAPGVVSTFFAFSPWMLTNKRSRLGFSDCFNVNRMTWVKTSLLWTLWRSEWGHKKGQERILQVNVFDDFISSLFDRAIQTKDISKSDPTCETDVLLQYDPDRRIIGRWWITGRMDFHAEGGRTAHFGLRKQALTEFLEYINLGSMTDITHIVHRLLSERPLHPTEKLYNALGLEPQFLD